VRRRGDAERRLSFHVSWPRLGGASGLRNQSSEGGGVGADKLIDLLAVLEDEERGHGADAEVLADVGELVDVDLGEEDARVLLLVGLPEARDSVSIGFSVCLLLFASLLSPRGGSTGSTRENRDGNDSTYLTRMGAMALQGPHQVAKQSSRTVSFLARASLYSSGLFPQ
jgi:hypothetical protein